MLSALRVFNSNIDEARHLGVLYDFLFSTVSSPMSFDDLLRSQIVYALSAFDKLIHDIIRIGMVQTFVGTRPPTSKYLNESLSIQIHETLLAATFPPKEHFFEQAISKKLRIVSYQDPEKVADGLSFIWNEDQKWQKISSVMGLDSITARRTLKLITDRRNAIVHEFDMDPATQSKYPVHKNECEDIINFLHKCGNAIVSLVVQA